MSPAYNRVFITLQNDRAGYGFSNRQPAGRCIIETQGGAGKLSLMVQDLLPATLYKAYTITKRGDVFEGLPVGTVVVDAKGKGALKTPFAPLPISKNGADPMANLCAVAVLAPNVKGGGIVSPLVGFTGEVVRWKDHFVDMAHEPAPIEWVQPTAPPITHEPVPTTATPTNEPASLLYTQIKAVASTHVDAPMPIDTPPETSEPTEPQDADIHEMFKAMARAFNVSIKELEAYATMPDNAPPSPVG